ncbi:MAG: hypothetical protein RL685_4618 [Pseudomonadota bacterium]|jgi:serine/threonine-protein kinase
MKRSPRWVEFRSCLLLLALVALGAPAAAQDAPQQEAQAAPEEERADVSQGDAQQKAAAEALFDEGRQLLNQGQYESACKKLEQSDAIDHGVGVLLYLGECYERSGRTASAWAIFREASSRAKAAGQLDRAKIADDRARRLNATLSRLVLLVPQHDRVQGFELLRNGQLIPPALYGVPFPVDAGQHELTARAPGRQVWSNIIEVKANGDFRNVQIPVLPESRVATAAASSAVAPSATSSTYSPGFSPEPGAAAPTGPTRELTPVYLLGGVGAVAIGVGAIFGVRASDKDDKSKLVCPSDCRTTQGANQNEAARTSALVANISYGVGAAALLTSAYLFFTAGSSSESAAQQASGLQVGGNVRQDEGFVSVSGAF